MMLTAPKLLPLLLLAATLHTAHAQQATNSDKTTKTKVKTKRAAAATGTTPPPPAGAPVPAPFPGGPAGWRGPAGPGAPGGLGVGQGPHHPGGPRHRPQALREVKTYSGTLSSYTTNPEGLYDGFLVSLNGTATRVHFPPHMAKALMATTRAGQTVRFEAVAGPAFSPPAATATTAATPAAAPHLELVSVGEGTTALQLTPPVRPEAQAAATATTVSSTIAQLRTDERGQLRGLVLADNTLLLVPPHVGEQLADKLKVGTSIQATALAVPAVEGIVAADALRRLRTQTLTINGTRFLVN